MYSQCIGSKMGPCFSQVQDKQTLQNPLMLHFQWWYKSISSSFWNFFLGKATVPWLTHWWLSARQSCSFILLLWTYTDLLLFGQNSSVNTGLESVFRKFSIIALAENVLNCEKYVTMTPMSFLNSWCSGNCQNINDVYVIHFMYRWCIQK